jgi:hypothetical protein
MTTLLVTAAALAGNDVRIELNVDAPSVSTRNTPLHATITLPDSLADVPPEHIAASLQPPGVTALAIPGQIVRVGEKTELWWIAPELKQGRPGKWLATLSVDAAGTTRRFTWHDTPDRHLDLRWNGRPVLRYMYAYDPSTDETLHETYKVYYHVFDATGENLLTKGSGGLYTHHRGIFVGWNRLTLAGKEYDFWHMKGVTQRHQKVLYQTAGPVLGRLVTLINWVGPDDQPIIIERREVTVFHEPRLPLRDVVTAGYYQEGLATLLECRTELRAVAGDIFLNGDPEHAGFQYRPHNDVADGDASGKARYLFHKDGIDAHQDQNLPWVAESYGLNGRRYSVQHMNHPDNPKPSKYSAYRDYGRFGAFFTKNLKAGQVLPLRYRIRIAGGAMPPRKYCSAQYAAFATPPNVTVVRDQP